MLRISVLNGPGATRLKLEGKLAHEWVREAEKAWAALPGLNGNTEIIVDLRDVSFVDDLGHELLAAMRHAGAELVGSGLLMAPLIEEIEAAECERGGKEKHAQSDLPVNKNGDRSRP
jgi:anti-anti-sigma regulatory factor